VDPSSADAVVIPYNETLKVTQEADDGAGSVGVWNAWQRNGDPGGAGWWLVISPP